MALLKSFSDVEKYVRLLSPDYQKKLLEEFSFLLEQFIEKQNELYKIEQDSSEAEMSLDSGFTIKAPPRPPSVGITRNTDDINTAIKNLQSSFGKNTGPLQNQTSFQSLEETFVNPIKTRKIADVNTTKLKADIIPESKPKKEILSIFDCLGFIVPCLTDLGRDFLGTTNSSTETHKLLKQIDGTLSMKQLYIMLYTPLTPGQYLEKIFDIFKDRYITFSLTNSQYIKSASTDTRLGDFLISMQYINKENLDEALTFQKEEKNVRNQRIMIGDALLALRLINEEQLYKALYLQKWFKYIITNL